MASKDPPLDEIVWRSPEYAQQMQGIHSNSILFYFAGSPFFDPTSNNAILFSQAMYNQNMLPIIQTREAFQARLKTMSGLEFMVAQEPAETAPNTGTGVWVIRKQTRRKRLPEEDEITVHSSYFVVGENIYMAPTVGDVLSILSSMNKFLSTASALPDFSPSLGYTYILPSSSTRLKAIESQLGQASKEGTPVPEVPNSKKAPSASNISNYLDTRLLEESLNIAMKYGDEYMDENPITGQPGDFHLSTTGRDKDKLVMPISKDPVSVGGRPGGMPKLDTDIAPARKGSKSEKSPKTPGGGIPKPKRRKSKALSAGGITPK
ncbi:hypothetical protein OIDMADRAFT_205478 [Oidiodendron maius Zn]|uniref:Mediator of RNA polymerase II transcription subunit 6 n=1 Tax=Oidiodendron maius (strain Zn) TaxID=913774 RepID=A0A0C3D213_OIDMZ|nr:hypothetical protein OIDMADRAFT_205478 [Oidiodendron maius Zn]